MSFYILITYFNNFMNYKIKKKRGLWNFDGNVPEKFIKHILKSVPFYNEGHKLILGLSDFFLKDNSLCYDIGSSTGDLLIKLSKFTNKKTSFIGVDKSNSMINFAKNNIKKNKLKNIKVLNKDINKLKLKKSDLIIAYYTLQFIEPRYKQLLLNKIYKSLNWGGALILFEKVRANDARFQDILNSLYYDFKEENGFKSNEIFDKEKSLRGVLEPFSDAGNKGLLKRAGFVDTISIYKYICFKGYLCVK